MEKILPLSRIRKEFIQLRNIKNKQYRYTMSEYAVEIERMTVKLENLFMDSGNLSMNYFVRTENALNEMEQTKTSGTESCK